MRRVVPCVIFVFKATAPSSCVVAQEWGRGPVPSSCLNPHVPEYVPVHALRAPSLTNARYAFNHENFFNVTSLQSNDFELFGLEQKFSQGRTALDARWKELQREAHPDKFAAQGASAQRVAMQWSVRINEAYQRLKDPLKRAAYLCELDGAAINAENNTAMSASFLMQQIEWREAQIGRAHV